MSSLGINCLKSAATTAVVGAAASRTVMWMSRKVENLTGRNVGNTVTSKIIPQRVRTWLGNCAKCFARPVKKMQHCVRWLLGADTTRPGWSGRRIQMYQKYKVDEILSVTLVPVLEEAIYRFGVQGGISLVLNHLGLPPSAVQAISISCSSFIFGLSHETDMETEFSDTVMQGLVLGIVKEIGNLPIVITAHALSNLAYVFSERASS